MLVAQAAWGIAYTFTSGATEAWLSGELSRATPLDGETPSEETRLSSVFLRASRWSSVAALVGIPAAFGLAGDEEHRGKPPSGTSSVTSASRARSADRRSRSVRESLTAAWVIPLTSPGRRATVLSTIGQFDAVGQMLIGPTFGLLASRAGVGSSLVANAAVMAPGVLLLARAGRSARDLSAA